MREQRELLGTSAGQFAMGMLAGSGISRGTCLGYNSIELLFTMLHRVVLIVRFKGFVELFSFFGLWARTADHEDLS